MRAVGKSNLWKVLWAGQMLIWPVVSTYGQSNRGFPWPSADETKRAGFSAAAPQEKFSANDLDTAALPQRMAGLIKENGFVELRRGRFSGTEGEVELTVLKLLDFKAAYSSFTNLKPAGAAPLSLGDGGVSSASQTLFWQNDFFVRLACSGINCAASSSVISLGEAVSRSIGEHTDSPQLAQYLPAAGRIVGSERYVLGAAAWSLSFPGIPADIIGFKDAAEAVVSDYRFRDEKARLVIVGFPTDALARHYYGTLPAGLQAADMGGAGFYTKRSGAMVAVAIGNVSVENARQLLDQIDISYSVKWIYRTDAPVASSGDSVTLFTTVVAAIFLTGFFCIGSIATGLLFGGSRFLLRILAPNNYFDKPERVELLRLNLLKKR